MLAAPIAAVLLMIAAAQGAAQTLSTGQSYPARPVRLIVPFAPGGNVMSAPKVARLLASRGSMLIASSSPDEWSFYDGGHGGYFCTSFIEYFMNRVSFANTDPAISWRDIIDNARNAAKRRSETDKYAEATQTPICYFNVY